jgi:hypothetical protein
VGEDQTLVTLVNISTSTILLKLPDEKKRKEMIQHATQSGCLMPITQPLLM